MRITLGYRAVGLLEEGEVTWFWIGSHADYDRLLRVLGERSAGGYHAPRNYEVEEAGADLDSINR